MLVGGIGKALSHYFANQGYNLVLIAKQEANLNRLFDDLKDQYPHLGIKTYHLDFAQPEIAVNSFEGILNQLETIDVLVNSAGVLKAGHIDLTFEQLSELINVHYRSVQCRGSKNEASGVWRNLQSRIDCWAISGTKNCGLLSH